jgi:hypothetical protein
LAGLSMLMVLLQKKSTAMLAVLFFAASWCLETKQTAEIG